MRKYGLDEGRIHEETATLAEPNNFIPSWVSNSDFDNLKETGDEDKKEVSNALRALRKKYDQVHKRTEEKKNDLELIQKEVKKISGEEHTVEVGTDKMNQEMARLETGNADVTEKHNFELLNQATYKHMLLRMEKDSIALQLRSNALVESIRSKNQIYKEEFEKQRMARENKLQSKYRLDMLMLNIEHEQSKRQERIISLQTSIQNKDEAARKREDRQRR